MKPLVTLFWFFSCDYVHVKARVGGNEHIRGLGPMNGGDPNDQFYYMQKDYLEAISVPKAWGIVDSAPKRTHVTIATIDNGIEASHPDLEGVVIEGYNIVDDNSDTRPRGPHGTNMAGIIGAIRNNKIGIAGILDGVSILPIFRGEIPTNVNDTKAFEYLIREKKGDVKVVLLTDGFTAPVPLLMQIIRRAAVAGMLVVISAGNRHLDMDKTEYYPCSRRGLHGGGIFCVAATNGTKMQLDDESNFGSAVDIAAPGYNLAETNLNEGYSRGTGTSGAAAIVAGIAGMLYSLEPSLKTKLTPAYIKSVIMDTATKGVKDNKGEKTLSFGRVNAAAAVDKMLGRGTV
ncbi:thermitase, putative [Perkinsus marinus ATCC 50983]|uniref:subtilisin n=1 Tax=Perkinsus marinus (strain ATCC 50983 / TXsc) TaxID=423536 RepID=C5LE82_PERM5|nr:thermitase, putative [Perkinsus marinus ATCC 50983]EER04950.1 thermitase, putative [Perkinsus marinus ATCC 50983]|eukprot:XP_002773134.1 thermitase, putative [Perkinsus marinus ATCC 50983]